MLNDDGTWVEASRYPSRLDLRWRFNVTTDDDETGFFLDDVAFGGSTD